MNWAVTVGYATMIAEYIIMFLFYKGFLGQENGSRIKNIMGCIIFVAVTALTKILLPTGAITISISMVLYILLTFLFDGNIKWKLFASVLYFVLLFIIDELTMFGLMWAGNADVSTVFNGGILSVYGLIISTVLILLATRIVVRFRKRDNRRISFQYWLAIVTFPIISIVLLYVLYDFNWRLPNADVTVTTAIAIVGILYINIFAFQMIEFFSDKAEREAREILLRESFEKQIRENERIEYERAAQNRFFHDLRHHSRLLIELVEKGDTADALDLISQITKLDSMEKKEYVNTSNPAINAIFNYRIAYAEARGISVEIGDLYFPEGLKFDIADLCIIFSNSLENAIEACMKIKDGDKFIKVGMRYRDGKLVYKISNSTDGNIIQTKKGFKSTKTTAGLHGLGIESMEIAVQKYGGTLFAEHKNNVFELGFSISNNR